MAYLYLTQNDGSELEFTLPDELVRIGRAADNDIHLDDDSASTFHAEIRTDGAHHILKDLGSTNGVRVNGERIQECTLSDGDLLRFGSVRGRYETNPVQGPDAPANAAPKVDQAPARSPVAGPSREETPARNSRAELENSGFGPKKKARDPEKSAYLAVGWLVGLTAVAAVALSIMMH